MNCDYKIQFDGNTVDEYDTDAVFKIELGKFDLTTWKEVFNFSLLNVFYSINTLHSKLKAEIGICVMQE